MSCEWVETDECFETQCGHAFVLNEGIPSDHEMKFCCFCGGNLEVVRAEESVSESDLSYVRGL